MSEKQRYEISICYTDKGNTRRYVNNVGTLWFDGQRGNIVIPPGVALHSAEGIFINVDLPRDMRQQGQGGGQQRGGGQGGGQGRGNQQRGGGRSGWGNDGDDDIPF